MEFSIYSLMVADTWKSVRLLTDITRLCSGFNISQLAVCVSQYCGLISLDKTVVSGVNFDFGLNSVEEIFS